MLSTLVRGTPIAPVAHDEQDVSDQLLTEVRVAELVMALSGCSARRAITLVREKPADSAFDRLVYALAATRPEIVRAAQQA